ncbi:hypothetical protein OG946_31240 [Streptomyces sp. NBC_01808]|uniref:hypothetical protein n=1 Tax=Streptomyces sp. NBC_01808 TaxID=2975947 RepID=UPI002DD973B1|nr:hypothetical protein [Streptomyces sp. NBC_01808]WSA41467.1 hypothetical protein OG946_31240 [Streptomyces sp. NBC_01808]
MSEHGLNLSSTRGNHPAGAHSLVKEPAPRRRRSGKDKPGGRLPLDWSVPHGPVSGAISATTGAGAVALLGAATSMPPGWPMAIGAAGAIGHGVGVSVRRKLTGRTLVTRCASWLLAGGWTTWAVATGPLQWAAAGSLAALGVGVGAMASHAAVHEEAAEEERMSAEAKELYRELNADRLALATEWEERIHRVSGVQVSVFAVEMWATGAGFSLAAELPAGGAVWTQIQNQAKGLAADARLPLGCAIHVEEGDRQGRVVLDIATENVIDRTYTYPTDYAPLSLLTGIPWGLLPNSDPVQVFLREACALILGPPGSGKSTFVDVVLAGFARCTDVLTWVIDFKAGASARPWIRPALEAAGKMPPPAGRPAAPAGTRPAVDWVASTPKEAQRMLRAALAINAARQHAYQDLMDAQDTTLLPISPQLPQIMIVVDEGAELLSAPSFRDPVMKDVQANVKKIMRTTRAMGLRLVLTAVDGNTSALGNTEVRKFSPVGVALTSGESAGNNAAKLFTRVKADASQLKAKGAGIIGAAGADGFAPTPFKGWKTAPSMAREVTLATSDRHPLLDAASADAAGEDYADRWNDDRAGWLWNTTTPAAGSATPDTPGADAGQERPAGLNLSYRKPTAGGTVDEEALAARFRAEIDAAFATTDEPGTPDARAPQEPTEGAGEDGGLSLSYRAASEPAQGAARKAALMLIIAAGPDGTGASAMERALAGTHGTRRPVIQGWLKEWAESGEIVRVGEGSKARYVHHRHAPGN